MAPSLTNHGCSSERLHACATRGRALVPPRRSVLALRDGKGVKGGIARDLLDYVEEGRDEILVRSLFAVRAHFKHHKVIHRLLKVVERKKIVVKVEAALLCRAEACK
eukprot:TRINITY_DN10290_c0_g2_i2.p2 TRINITY_DN10290_c0_g2~~TRINITY_DN10290_c0_g2_i2.p2  ORF type:complete len:107 (-),score=10.20 TRINITY_DN10290_c0_g2_i2:92-412(-)